MDQDLLFFWVKYPEILPDVRSGKLPRSHYEGGGPQTITASSYRVSTPSFVHGLIYRSSDLMTVSYSASKFPPPLDEGDETQLGIRVP